MLNVRLLSTAMCAAMACGMASAQDTVTQPEQPAFEPPAQYAPSWSDEGIAQAVEMLSGTWRSA